jgi:hypothetical protein
MLRPFLFRLATILLGVGLTLGTFEALSWAFFRLRDLADRDLRIFAPATSGGLPIAVKPHFTQSWNTSAFQVTVRTNSLGLREDFELPTGGRIDVGALGDSFTFGYGVEVGERFSDVLRARLDGRLVVSFSYPNGWAPPYYHLYLRENPALVPRVAVLGLCLSNDLSVDMRDSTIIGDATGGPIRIEAPFREVDELGRLVGRDFNPVSRLLRRLWSGRLLLHLSRGAGPTWIHPIYQRFENWRQLDNGELDEHARQALDQVRGIRDLMHARGGRLVVLLIPWSFYVDGRYPTPYPPPESARIRKERRLPAVIGDWCRAQGLVCVDPIDRLRAAEARGEQTYFMRDAHWTRVGHRVGAEAIHGEVEKALAEAR